MAIEFNFGEHLHQDSSTFLLNLITTTIGAFLGFVVALFINRLQDNNIKKKEHNELVRKYYDQLRFLNLYIESIIDTTVKQAKNYSDFSIQSEKTPLEINLPVILATYDFERLKNLSTGDLFNAFVFFNKSDIEYIETFKKLFTHVDYLYRLFQEYERQIEKHHMFIHKDQLFVRDCFENISLKIGLRSKNIQKEYPKSFHELPEYIYLNNLGHVFLKLTKTNIEFNKIRDEYFKQINDTIFENVKDQVFADEIFYEAKRGLSRLVNIEANSKRVASDFKNCEKLVYTARNYLEVLSEKLKKINMPDK